MKKELIKNFYSSILLVGFSLVICEVLVRLVGWKPRDSRIVFSKIEQEELGWINKSGLVKEISKMGRFVEYNFLENGSRRTSEWEKNQNIRKDKKSIILIGGSITEGYGINDKETFAWKLQSALSNFNILNYGVKGYGTHQSLKLLEKVLKETKLKKGSYILYNYFTNHEYRNIGHPNWQLPLCQNCSNFSMPYSVLDSNTNQLIDVDNKKLLPEFYFRESLALVTLIEDLYARISLKHVLGTQVKVTKLLFKEMAELANRYNTKLLIPFLYATELDRENYFEYLKLNNIDIVDCTPINGFTEDLILVDDSHPNAKCNSLYSTCILNKIEEMSVEKINKDLN